MADKHAYVVSAGGLVKVVNQFRKSFPASVDANTLRKLGYAPNNESYVLNVLRRLDLIDDAGGRTETALKVFSVHDDAKFAVAFAELVKSAYQDLFDLHQESSWTLDLDSLISFFRSSDGTSAIVGKRQAATFQLLAAFSGHGDVPEPRSAGVKASPPAAVRAKATRPRKAVAESASSPRAQGIARDGGAASVGLTVRVEVSLPADGDQATYDRIFKSIRENLLNG